MSSRTGSLPVCWVSKSVVSNEISDVQLERRALEWVIREVLDCLTATIGFVLEGFKCAQCTGGVEDVGWCRVVFVSL